MNSRPIIGITMGDPGGIGPELCLRTLAESSVLGQCVPVVFGDIAVLERVAKGGLPSANCQKLSLTDWEASPPVNEPAVVDCAAVAADEIRPGEVSAACG